ncbi:uncharacterized protein LOC105740527 [Nomascus leucogenys]|uniref:uncharacterized protein LOC105740527 n=1 Tax=Nomascus leucogenys TaxID=61853 RepID=UPI00062A83E3|nr:uncharacterized protein LOC105740527 [Nomascus leucogenys]
MASVVWGRGGAWRGTRRSAGGRRLLRNFTWSHTGRGLLLGCGAQCLPSLPHRPAAPGSRHASSGHTHTCRLRPSPLSCLLLFTHSGDLTHRSTGLWSALCIQLRERVGNPGLGWVDPCVSP